MHLAQLLAQRVTAGCRNIGPKTGQLLRAPARAGRPGDPLGAVNDHGFPACFPGAAVSLFRLGICLQSSESSWASRLCIIWLPVLKATSCYVWLLGGEMLSWLQQ